MLFFTEAELIATICNREYTTNIIFQGMYFYVLFFDSHNGQKMELTFILVFVVVGGFVLLGYRLSEDKRNAKKGSVKSNPDLMEKGPKSFSN